MATHRNEHQPGVVVLVDADEQPAVKEELRAAGVCVDGVRTEEECGEGRGARLRTAAEAQKGRRTKGKQAGF